MEVDVTNSGISVGGAPTLAVDRGFRHGLVAKLSAHPVATGAGLGLLWGVAMRVWMRFISTSPEFSWSGTLFIFGASTVVGMVLGLARHRRRVGGAGWWRLSLLALGLLGAGGAVMWPTVILWGVAFGRRATRWLSWPLLALGAAAQYPVIDDVIFRNWRFGDLETVVATAWYLPMLAAEAWAFSVVFAPGDRTPRRVKVGFLVGAAIVAALVLVVVIGAGSG